MGFTNTPLIVFTKPWKDLSIRELGEFVSGLGLDGIELPVRPDYQVEPDHIETEMPEAVKTLADCGLKIYSVAGNMDEKTVRACGESGIPILRVMIKVDMELGYMAVVDKFRKDCEALVPLLDEYGVTIGVQNHARYFVGSALGLVHAVEPFSPKHVAAVLDVGHCGLDGEPEDMAIDIAWPHLCMVNLKNGYMRRVNGPESKDVEWIVHWTTGRQGVVSWYKTAEELKKRNYEGPICLCAEYRATPEPGDLMGDAVNPLIAQDAEFARELFR
jgi:sugar phosphate isomerase/epimerase